MHGLLVAVTGIYTLILIFLGRLGKRRAKGEDFLTGGRQFNVWQVFLMISALWCSWIFIVEVETAYLFGLSAMWFGFSVGLQALFSIYVMGSSLSKKGFITNSHLLGDHFGAAARTIAGLIIALTFPVFAMSNVLAAAAFIHVVAGWPLLATLIGTALVVLVYILAGGIWSLAYTQIANFVVIFVGLLVGVGLALHAEPWGELHRTLQPRYFALTSIGWTMIGAWIFSLLLNVVSAQAEFQILMAAKDMRTAKIGLTLAMISIAVFSILSAVIGLCVRAATADPKTLGVMALPMLYAKHYSGLPVLIMTLTLWAAALMWSAPLMFSGASSLGHDLLRHWAGQRLSNRAKFCVQVCLPVQAALIVVYGLARPDQLAWWQVFGLTLRNGAIFAPTVAILVWPGVTRVAAIFSIVVGSASGLIWNALGHFSAQHFFLGVNPMWVGATSGILILIGGALLTARIGMVADLSAMRHKVGLLSASILGIGLIALAKWFDALHAGGYLGPDLLIVSVATLALCAAYVRLDSAGSKEAALPMRAADS
ncbi:MAG: hypothetical protein M0015_05285 [Betaproteobacteria bacterium]|nr:hypothetical protein [Betaproteobacteria bacterium]